MVAEMKGLPQSLKYLNPSNLLRLLFAPGTVGSAASVEVKPANNSESSKVFMCELPRLFWRGDHQYV